MPGIRACSVASESSPFPADNIERREPTPDDVQIEILFCGICHSDLHQARNEWKDFMPMQYPCVPGHEIVGRVVKTGSNVSRVQAGDLLGVGCLVDSCGQCEACAGHEEIYCAAAIVVDQRFVRKVPGNLDPAGAAPLLCAGITTYSPLRHWKVGPGQKAGVVGLGGMGHMGVKFAKAMGAEVILFTTSPKKVEDGLRLGASQVL
jgi:uncharacterized zinc-type alcohol dehydrogenase-like protein